MNWIKANWFKLGLLLLLFIIACILFYKLIYFPDKLKRTINSSPEMVLRSETKKYSDLVDVGLCREAYDTYVTESSKASKGFDGREGFLSHCKYIRNGYAIAVINKVIFSNETRADVQYRATSKYDNEVSYFVETWIKERGIWKRDF